MEMKEQTMDKLVELVADFIEMGLTKEEVLDLVLAAFRDAEQIMKNIRELG